MNDLDPVADRALAVRLERIAARLDALLRVPAPSDWEPGLRRPAIFSDLLRALAGGWSPNETVTSDPWSVPTGHPEGAETWHSRFSAASWLGVDRAAELSDLVPSGALHDHADLAEQLASSSSRHPLALRSHQWTSPALIRRSRTLSRRATRGNISERWLVLTGVARHLGPDGPRSLIVATSTWRVHDDLYVEAAAYPGRDGILLIAPTGPYSGEGPQVEALGAFAHLLRQAIPRSALDVLTHRWRARLLATYKARVATGDVAGQDRVQDSSTDNRWGGAPASTDTSALAAGKEA